MKKILFLHGFTSSGQCEIAQTLKEHLAGVAEIISPDLPLYPEKAIEMVGNLCREYKPSLIVGSSCGAFYAQLFVCEGRKAILINPFFKMSEFLAPRIGVLKYKSPRRDGKQEFEITQDLVVHFMALEEKQFLNYTPDNKQLVHALFGKQDTLAHFRTLYDTLYCNALEFDGGHTMTSEIVRQELVPLIKQVI